VIGGLDSLESSPYVTLSRGAFSASSLVTPIRADTSRARVVPVCNTDLSLPTPPHTALVDRGRTASQTGRRPWQGRLRAEEDQVEKSPWCAEQEALRKPPGTAENQAETGVLAGPPSWLEGGSL
jgi:hypothetical protein